MDRSKLVMVIVIVLQLYFLFVKQGKQETKPQGKGHALATVDNRTQGETRSSQAVDENAQFHYLDWDNLDLTEQDVLDLHHQSFPSVVMSSCDGRLGNQLCA